jgi:hypothetical protein
MIGRLGLVLVVFVALAGTATGARRDPWDPQTRYNAADQALARAIRIQRDDLGAGDWRVETFGDEDNSLPECKNPDLSDLVLTGKAQNPNFSRNGSLVGSEGEVWATERDAATAWRRSTRFDFGKCLPAAMRKGFAAAQGVSLKILSSGPVRMPKLTPRMFTYRISFRIKGPKAALQGRLSIYAFARGRIDASLMVISFGRPAQPIPDALERRLATRVAARLKGR